MKNWISIFILSVFANGIFADVQCSKPVRVIENHRDIFILGTLGFKRQILPGGGSMLLGIHIFKISESDILWKHGVRKNDFVTEVCGIVISEGWGGNMDAPICCKNDYPAKLTVKIERSNLEKFVIEIPLENN